MSDPVARVAMLWRGEPGLAAADTRNYSRLAPIMDALSATGVEGMPVLYSDDRHEAVRDRLLGVDGVLVWIDPIDDSGDRAVLESVLEQVAARGVWVSAHPRAVWKIGTKEVLVRTKSLGWGSDCYLYTTPGELRLQFPSRLVTAGPRVLKQHRGNGGIGVWKVALLDPAGSRLPVRAAHRRWQGHLHPVRDQRLLGPPLPVRRARKARRGSPTSHRRCVTAASRDG